MKQGKDAPTAKLAPARGSHSAKQCPRLKPRKMQRAFEEIIELDENITGEAVTAEIHIEDVSYNISSDNTLMLSTDIRAEISVYTSAYINAVSDISVDGEIKKIRDGDYSIKLYYGSENEDVWEIAKRYSTCVDAIIEENELDGECLDKSGMLIIPIVS